MKDLLRLLITSYLIHLLVCNEFHEIWAKAWIVRQEGRIGDCDCEVAMCVCRSAHQDWLWLQNAHFTILVPIWLQDMALTAAVPGTSSGGKVNDDWWETPPEWPELWTRWHEGWPLTPRWSGRADGAILTLMMVQARMTSRVTRYSRDTSQHYRGGSWPRHTGLARGV